MPTGRKCFEQNSKDEFELEMTDVGEKPKRLLIGHDGAGHGAGWHLASVSVTRTKVNGKKIPDSETVLFNCGYLSYIRGSDRVR